MNKTFIILFLAFVLIVSSSSALITTSSMPTTMGQIYTEDNTAITVITVANNYTMVSGNTTFDTDNVDFSMPSNGTLRYVGDTMKHCHMGVTISVKGVAANDVVIAGVFKNGVRLNGSKITTKLGASGDITSTVIHVMSMVEYNDSIMVGIANSNDGDDFIVTDLNLFSLCM